MKDKEFEHIAPVLRRRSVATARSFGLDADDAEDVAQDALLKLWSLRGELKVERISKETDVDGKQCAYERNVFLVPKNSGDFIQRFNDLRTEYIQIVQFAGKD